MEVFARDDLVQVGWTEDGEADIARRFYLVAQDDRGARAAHDYSRLAYRGNLAEVEAAMEALAARVRGHLAAGGALDRAHWVEVDPAYGSEAYQVLDRFGYFADMEVVRAVDAGERVARDVVDAAYGHLAFAPDLAFPT